MSYYPQQTAWVGPAPYRCSTAHVVIAWILAIATGAYLLPWAIATTRNRPNVGAIALINIFLGWSVIGWIIALVMACGANPPPTNVLINHTSVYQPAPPPVQPWAGYHPQSGAIGDDRPRVSNDTVPLELDSYDPYPQYPAGPGSAYEVTQPLPPRHDGDPGWRPQQ